jgi:hypothetical protein
MAGISEEAGLAASSLPGVEKGPDERGGAETDDLEAGLLAAPRTATGGSLVVVRAWYGDLGSLRPGANAACRDVTAQVAAMVVEASGGNAPGGTLALNPRVDLPATLETTPYRAGDKVSGRSFGKGLVAQLKAEAKASEALGGRWPKRTLDVALGWANSGGLVVAHDDGATAAAATSAAAAFAANVLAGGTMSHSLCRAKAGLTPGVPLNDPVARALAGDLGLPYRSLCLHLSAPGLPPGTLAELRTPAQPGGGRLSVFVQLDAAGAPKANWPLRLVAASASSAAGEGGGGALGLAPPSLLRGPSLPELAVQLFLEARARRRQVRAKAAHAAAPRMPVRVVKALGRMAAWAREYSKGVEARDQARAAKCAEAAARGEGAQSVRRDPRKELAKQERERVLGMALFASWMAFLLFLLLWMLQAFPGMQGYPIVTWVPTKCHKKTFAAANKALCGLE